MNYLDTDYYTLIALQRTGTVTAEKLLYEMQRDIGWMSCADSLASSLAVLSADGYVSLQSMDHTLTASTLIALTDAGRSAVQVGGLAKLFSGMRDKAIRKNERAFCALPRPDAAPLTLDRASFASYAESAKQDRELIFLMVENAENGLYELSLHQPYCSASEESDDKDLSLLCDGDGLRRMLGDVLDTALYLTESRKVRKLALYGPGKAYVVTFCEVPEDEEGSYADCYMRVTAAPILFNRQRFIGKRDSDLDYAQCGTNELTVSLASTGELCGMILGAVCRRTDLLDEELGRKVNELYSKI